MKAEPKLTYDELTTIISRFTSSVYKLEASGDYPEKVRDKKILRKLIDIQWYRLQEGKEVKQMKYLVTWTEKHSLIAMAENEEEAIEKAQKDVDPYIIDSLYSVCDTKCTEQEE